LNRFTNELSLVDDAFIALSLSMSVGWVRNQRWRRRHKQDHILTIDPVMVGTSPRYRIEDVSAWIASLEVAND